MCVCVKHIGAYIAEDDVGSLCSLFREEGGRRENVTRP